MRIIEQGKDKDNQQCWYVLDEANLIGVYYTLEEAQKNL
jgi:hypothetical protein